MKRNLVLVFAVGTVCGSRIESSFLSLVSARSSSDEKGTSIRTKITRALHCNLSFVLNIHCKDTVILMLGNKNTVSKGVSSMVIEVLIIVKLILERNHGTNTKLVGVAMVVKVEEDSVSACVIVQVKISPGNRKENVD